MVNEVVVPVQVAPAEVVEGETTMVAVTGELVIFVAVKDAMSPDPLAGSPMEVFEFVQLYSVPGTLPENWTREVAVLWHATWFVTGFTVGIGATFTARFWGGPGHPLRVGVM